MKIALVSLQFEKTSTGGGGVHVENICKQFIDLGHKVTVISIHTDKTINDVQFENGEKGFSIENRDNLRIVRLLIDRNIEQPYVGSKKVELERIERFSYAAVSWIKERIDEFDVINLHGHHMLPGLMAKELHGLGPVVVSTLHSLESTFISQKGDSLGSFEATEEVLNKLRNWEAMSRFADYIIVNSILVRNEFIEIATAHGAELKDLDNRIRLISSGCNEDFLMDYAEVIEKFSETPETINLVTFSRVDPSKGIEYSIKGAKAAARLVMDKLNLTIAGIPDSDEYVNKLKSELTDLPENLEVNFRFTSAISPPEEKKEILDKQHIYILPTLKEPFGMSIVEASARGNMIVSTDTTGPVFMMEDKNSIYESWGMITRYGALAKITNDFSVNLAENLGKAIAWTINNRQGGERRVIDFNKKIKKYWTWEGIGKQYIELFLENEK
ncbi:MAG: hypothetical protein B6D61_13395 [Bacteroidetes bacterium 4484_249]|nr:MAG: hypothetical protein B6D61_13395 [Bacteroidetes bacterium 4484_249]